MKRIILLNLLLVSMSVAQSFEDLKFNTKIKMQTLETESQINGFTVGAYGSYAYMAAPWMFVSGLQAFMSDYKRSGAIICVAALVSGIRAHFEAKKSVKKLQKQQQDLHDYWKTI